MESRGRTWAEEYPHRRWFLDYYRLPPSDPRYLGMTDEEILLDFYSVKAATDAIQQVWEETDRKPEVFTSVEAARITPDPVPPGRPRIMAFEADKGEFRQWYEANIGPWTHD